MRLQQGQHIQKDVHSSFVCKESGLIILLSLGLVWIVMSSVNVAWNKGTGSQVS